ncbi:Alpha/Beta hydrolase protein [Phialemonium atrogriseum]|uniref:Carboxylic ester hydrolase n=1 Tax=Phialemonium atrogriseum TaxID=1093897 RepID=A0AAJ0C417_9PEZI|nr:Alpha/Beta hydrolase protein [Phialemonium atrogriseum]KAK1768319.1 Alpha/Beta hydrolase protein [Phialemonium atrogriseum]
MKAAVAYYPFFYFALLTPACPRQQQQPAPAPDPLTGPRVDLNYTTYVGSQLPNGVNQFLGMRYAAAPLGDLRWRAPLEPPSTGQVQPALQFRSICLGLGMPYPQEGHDEDCLFVNVWAPANATDHSRLPVWVFIQGGGYVSLTNANWNGTDVVQRSGNNIVMVNFNYRVGLWGFLASERLRQDGDLNIGMLDQRRLLLWVQDHITKFGGDPSHVVIHGASAGAGSVALHLTAYGGRDDGLFVGGVCESLFFPAQPYLSELEWQFDRVVRQAGCGAADRTAQMACLRGKDTAALQAANVASAFPGRTAPPTPLFYWTPCVDGVMIEDLPYLLFEEGRFIRVPVLFGTDTDEGSIFAIDATTHDEIGTFFQDNFPRLAANDTAMILNRYALQPALPKHGPWFPTASLAYGEATFICPTINVLAALAAGGGGGGVAPPAPSSLSSSSSSSSSSPTHVIGPDIFAYRYDVRDADNAAAGLGVPHIFEAAAVFGPGPGGVGAAGPAAAGYGTYNAPIVPVVMDYFISFVRALDPNPFRDGGAPRWEGWWSGCGGGWLGDGDGGWADDGLWRRGPRRSWRRLVIDTGNTRMEDVPAEQVDRCDFWASLASTTRQKARKG